MDKKERIKELTKLIKNLKVDRAQALQGHYYEYAANLKNAEKKYLMELEDVKNTKEDGPEEKN